MADIDVQVELMSNPQINVELVPAIEMPVTIAGDAIIDVDVAARGPAGADGGTGPQGDPGIGVPTGGTTGQVLAKATDTDYDTEWVEQTGGSGGGAVDSVNGQAGVVVLDADDIDDTSTTHKFVTSTDVTKLSNLSGTNTGDQDLSSYATKTGTETLTNKTISGSNNTLSDIAQSSVTNLTTDLAGKASSSHTHTESDISDLGDYATSTELSTGLSGKSDTGHTHDDRYYTETETDNLLANKVTSFADPNADRIVFWDDSAGAYAGLAASTGLTISGTNMTVRTASATQTGIVELATTTETTTATDTARAVTPAGIGAERSATATLTNKTIDGGSNTLTNIAQGSVTNLTSDLAGKASSSHTHAIDDLSDVTISAPSVGQVIKYNGSGWVNDTDATSGGAGATNLSATLSASNTIIESDTGTDATIPAVDGTNAGVMTPTMKSKLDGIETAADVTDATNVAAAGAFMKSSDDLDDITAGTTNKHFTATDENKLDGIAAGATANSSDATLLARANHTGTQTAATISDFDTEVSNNTDVAANTAARHTHSNSTVLNNTTASFTTADETKLDGIEALADVTDATNVDAAGAVMNSDTSTASMSFVVDEDNMASNSATKVPTQQSVKAYVDTEIAGVGGGTGDVVGPASATNNAVAVFDGTTGKLLKNSNISVVYGPSDEAEIAAQSGTFGSSASYPDGKNGVYTNSIDERTASAGVTVDGVLIKDGLVDGKDVSTLTANTGDVVGPASSTDNNIPRFDSTTGKLLQTSTEAVITDTGRLLLGPTEAEDSAPEARLKIADNTGALSDLGFTAYGGGYGTIHLSGATGTAAAPGDTTAAANVGAIRFQKRASGTFSAVSAIVGTQDGSIDIDTTGSGVASVNAEPIVTTTGTQTLTNKTLSNATNTFSLGVTSWTPTITPQASMTFTGVSTTAWYINLGDVYYIWMRTEGTTGGTASVGFNVTNLPFNVDSTEQALAAVGDFGANDAAWANTISSTEIIVRRPGVTAWNIGASRGFILSGLLKKA